MTNPALARIQNLQTQIMFMASHGPVSAGRVEYCTAGKFTAVEIAACITMLETVGLLPTGLHPAARMTASAAAEYFGGMNFHAPIAPGQVNEFILDLVQMSEISIETRAALGDAADDLLAGLRDSDSLRQIAGAYNRLAGH